MGAAMLDALRTDQSIGQRLQIGRLSGGDHDFEAIIVVQVDMQRGQDGVMVLVLQFRQLVLQQARMVIVNQRDGSDNLGVRRFHRFLNQLGADEIAKCLRSARVSLLFD